MSTGRQMLARELPKKRRPTEVSALIIGSAGAIGWHNLKNMSLHCGCRWHPQIDHARACGCVRIKEIFTKENTDE
jgi:hypothetical protein